VRVPDDGCPGAGPGQCRRRAAGTGAERRPRATRAPAPPGAAWPTAGAGGGVGGYGVLTRAQPSGGGRASRRPAPAARPRRPNAGAAPHTPPSTAPSPAGSLRDWARSLLSTPRLFARRAFYIRTTETPGLDGKAAGEQAQLARTLNWLSVTMLGVGAWPVGGQRGWGGGRRTLTWLSMTMLGVGALGRGVGGGGEAGARARRARSAVAGRRGRARPPARSAGRKPFAPPLPPPPPRHDHRSGRVCVNRRRRGRARRVRRRSGRGPQRPARVWARPEPTHTPQAQGHPANRAPPRPTPFSSAPSPAVILSFVVGGVSSLMSALVYAEFAAREAGLGGGGCWGLGGGQAEGRRVLPHVSPGLRRVCA
jgi:hypothetical protein